TAPLLTGDSLRAAQVLPLFLPPTPPDVHENQEQKEINGPSSPFKVNLRHQQNHTFPTAGRQAPNTSSANRISEDESAIAASYVTGFTHFP
ncbi:MAG: hypothetical protein J0I57_11920, partial [Hyphomicrobium sp.]|nr:hypothetical protein [Hyphomicrobium sp.]